MSEDNSGYWKILEPIWYDDDLNSEAPEIYLKRFQELTEAQQVLFPTHWFYSEINNGGFHKCFYNATGRFAPEAVLGFKKLGLVETAEVVQKAIDIFEKPFPRDPGKYLDFLDSFVGETREEWDPFYRLDNEFYSSFRIEGAKIWEDDKFLIAADEFAKTMIS